MKMKTISSLLAVFFISGGFATAQNQAKPTGKGYGGPPQTEEERVARQQANGGVCPTGGLGEACETPGQGNGQGKRAGARDGTGKGAGNGKGQRSGPRNGSGNQNRKGNGRGR